MYSNVRSLRRRLKQCIAGLLFVGLLIGASGTVFTVFAVAIGQLGTGGSGVAAVHVVPAVVDTALPSSGSQGSTAPSHSSGNTSSVKSFRPPVMEYSNTQPSIAGTSPVTTTSTPSNIAANDGVNSQLANAMQRGGVYIGQRVQNTFGSMLKGVLNALFINTN